MVVTRTLRTPLCMNGRGTARPSPGLDGFNPTPLASRLRVTESGPASKPTNIPPCSDAQVVEHSNGGSWNRFHGACLLMLRQLVPT